MGSSQYLTVAMDLHQRGPLIYRSKLYHVRDKEHRRSTWVKQDSIYPWNDRVPQMLQCSHTLYDRGSQSPLPSSRKRAEVLVLISGSANVNGAVVFVLPIESILLFVFCSVRK